MPKGIKGFQIGHEQFNSGNTHFKKGYTPWNKGIEMWKDREHPRGTLGKPPWNKGKKTGLIPKTAFKKGYKHSEEAKEKMKGRVPWNKLGVRIPYPYSFNNQLKEAIRKRDNYECQLCAINQEELKQKLVVHHIDYSKKDSSESNLISLCRSCHGMVHCVDKDFWKEGLKNIQEKIKGGEK